MNAQAGLFDEPRAEPMIGSGRIFIGTSGYSFPDWEGAFYPKGLSKRDWLAFYAREFPAAEINATYYRLPSAASFEAMARSTPAGYPFWVKVPGEATHGAGDPSDSLRAFVEAIRPLTESGRIAGALAQFPNSFKPASESRERLLRIRDGCSGLRLAVEFRRLDWQEPGTPEFLTAEGLIGVNVDLPLLTGLPTREGLVYSGVAYLRLHGRNRKTWYHPERGDRYDYDYPASELKEIARLTLDLDRRAMESYVFFNNCHMGQAVKNARMLRDLLGKELKSIPL